MTSLRISLSIKSFVSGIRAFFNAYKKRVIADGGVVEGENCAIDKLKNPLLNSASLVLIPSGVKATKVYSERPTNGSGDFTFARASTATRTNASGVIESVASGVPRLDYMTASGTLGTCPMLEVEGQRTNLALQSENFSTTWATNNSSVTTNVVTSPAGTLTADEIVSTTNSNANVRISQAITIASGTTYSASFYVKPNTQRYIFINLTATGSTEHYVTVVIDTDDFTVGQTAVGTTSGTLVSTNIEAASNGFYRVTLTASINRTDGNIRIGFANAKTGNFINSTGDVAVTGSLGNSFYLWGAQLEAGAFRSTYIPTTTAAVTRLADQVSISGTSALIGQTEGTIFIDVDFRSVSTGGIRQFFSLEGSVGSQFSGVGSATSNSGNNVTFSGSANYNLSQGRHKIVCVYNQTLNQSKIFVDGAQRGTTGTFSGFLATIDRISILGRINPFTSFDVDRQQFGGCNQFAIWKTALTNAQCIQLSTL